MIDAHHHLWDLSAVQYPWLMEKGAKRFFGDPAPIQRDYLIDEFRTEAAAKGVSGSVHIQVGAADPMDEAMLVQSVADTNPDWPMAQVVFLRSDIRRFRPATGCVQGALNRARGPSDDAVRQTSPSISIGELILFYEITKERHSVRAASRLSLNVLRIESDPCEVNRL